MLSAMLIVSFFDRNENKKIQDCFLIGYKFSIFFNIWIYSRPESGEDNLIFTSDYFRRGQLDIFVFLF